MRVIEKVKKKRERESEIEKKEKREERKINILFIYPCYSRLYIPILTVAGCKFFLSFHTWMELLFMGLVCKIATGGVYTPNANTLREALHSQTQTLITQQTFNLSC